MPGIQLDLLLAALGEEATKKLLQAKGGQTVWIPKKEPQADHWLRQLLGPQLTGVFCRHFGGEQLVLPKGRRFQTLALREKVKKLQQRGWSQRQIAQELSLHINTVQRLVKLQGFPLRKL